MNHKMDFQEELKQRVDEANTIVEKYLPQEESGFLKTMIDAMNYSMRAGGKKLRPILMMETYRLFGGTSQVIEPFIAAIEMIHTQSLVHDDLPAMDNDEYRRGRKTTHVVFGEDIAILAGDVLLNYAYETAAKAFAMEPMNEKVGKAFSILAGKAGLYGMIGGQSVDVESDKETLNPERQAFYADFRGGGKSEDTLIAFIQDRKTCALLESSMMIGAVLAGASEEEIAKIEQAARMIGRAFQIQDDILDETSTQEELGKPIHSDQKNGKRNYFAVNGLEASKKAVESYSRDAVELIAGLPGKNEFLNELIIYLIYRNK